MLPPATSPNHREPPRIQHYQSVALIALTAVLLGLCVLIAIPFLPALTWGVAFAVIAWPLHARIARAISSTRWAAGLTTVLVVAAVAVSGLLITYQLASEAAAVGDRMRAQTADKSMMDRIREVPALAGPASWLDRMGVDLEGEVHKAVVALTRDAAAAGRGSLMALLQFAVAVFILYYLLCDRDLLLRRVRGLLPLAPRDGDRIVQAAGDSIHASLYASLVTSLINATCGFALFWLLGLPSPTTWAVVMFFLSLMPIVGTWLVWIPAAAYLLVSDQWPQALVLATWGVAASIVVDNIIHSRIAGDRMRLHQVPTMIAFLGGLAVFGVSGLILGPGIQAVTVAVLEHWSRPIPLDEPSALALPSGAE